MAVNFNQKIIKKSVLIAIIGTLFSCSNNTIEEVNQVTIDEKDLGEVSHNVILYFSDNGISKIKLEAPVLEKKTQYDEEKEKIKTSNLVCPEGMVVTFFDSLGREESTLSAKYGRLLSEEQFLIVKDSVVFNNPNKETLETELLNIFFGKDSITTPEKVKITTKDGVIVGKGLTSNTNFTQYKLNQITDSYYNFKEDE